MWENRNSYAGISVLPFDGGSYVQAPFEDCDEETYNRMLEQLKEIDLTQVVEEFDETERVQEIACAGGQCELPTSKWEEAQKNEDYILRNSPKG